MPPRKIPADEIEHGTSVSQMRRCKAYNGVACKPCLDARKVLEAASYRLRVARLLADPTIRPHGDASTKSNWGCLCTECGEVYRRKLRERRGVTSRRMSVPRGPRPNIPPFGREWINA